MNESQQETYCITLWIRWHVFIKTPVTSLTQNWRRQQLLNIGLLYLHIDSWNNQIVKADRFDMYPYNEQKEKILLST